MDDKTAFLENIKRSLLPLNELKDLRIEGLRSAAVLVPLIWDENQWKLMFIHRSNIGEFHRGEVAFPGGGKEDQDEDLYATALREVEEELGIPNEKIEILGFLRSISTISKYLVTPFVGHIHWPVRMNLETSEVNRVFSIPLAWLADSKNWEQKDIEIPGRGWINTILYNEYETEKLWGLTARITQTLLGNIMKNGHHI